MAHLAAPRSTHQARGFSLIELMLALALGVVITAGIVQLFVGNNQTYTLLTGQARLQESARYGMDFIARSARTAGYFGCDPDQDKVYNTLNAAWNQAFELDITTPIQAFHGTSAGNTINDWTPNLTLVPRQNGAVTVNSAQNGAGINVSDGGSGELRPLSDILVFRSVDIPGARIAAIIQPAADPVVEDDGNLGFSAGDFAVISNCEQAALFRITGIASAAGEATLARAAGAGLYQNSGTMLSEQGIAYGEANNGQGSTVGRVLTNMFYVGRAAGTDNRGNEAWSLWRKVSDDPPVELVEGIEDLQVLFGIDTTPNNNVDAANRYVPFNQVANNAIRAVRITLVASSVDVVTDDGNPLRRTFSQTISFRNG